MRQRSRPFFRAIVVATAALHVLTTVPLVAADDKPTKKQASVDEAKKEPPAEAKPPVVKVRRTLPDFKPPSSTLDLSEEPTEQELFRARIFEEPLVPMGGSTTAEENRALGQALEAWVRRTHTEDHAAIERFLAARPESPWRVSLLTNMGIVYRNTGYFMKALQAWEEAWRLGQGETDPRSVAVADRALAQLADLNSRLGRADRLEALFDEIEGRNVRGSASEVIAGAKQGLHLMNTRPQEAFPCGPLALDRILAFSRSDYRPDKRVLEFPSTKAGTSLTQIRDLATSVGLPMQMARRESDAEIRVPAVVHWKAGHFAALVESQEGSYRVQDPTFGRDLWVSRQALLEETTGYFLVPAGKLPEGWRGVEPQEGSQVWGKGASATSDPNDGSPEDDQEPKPPECNGMAGYAVHSMLVSLNITDTPVGYAPPRGPTARFTVRYNQREAFQPQIFSYVNLGPKWTFDWFSYVEDNPGGALSQAVTVYRRGGGREEFTSYDAGTATYAPARRSRAVLARTSPGLSPVTYERRLSDGSIEGFGLGMPGTPRKVLMTQIKDPQGNVLTLSYDASYRLVGVTDAIGQVTTLSYELPYPNDLLITRVTDPFGRYASFEYNASGRLQKITDVIGITSEFQYGSGDFIQSLTTPYGTTSFEMGESGRNRWIEITDPLGGKERVEYRDVDPTTGPILGPRRSHGHDCEQHVPLLQEHLLLGQASLRALPGRLQQGEGHTLAQ